MYVEQHIFFEENIDVYEEVHEDLTIEEEPKIKIVEEINEDSIREKDLEVDIYGRNHWRRNYRGSCQRSPRSHVGWLQCSSSYYFGGRHWNKVYWFYWVGKIWFDHWLLFGEYFQLHEDQGTRSSNCLIDDFQVC